MFSMRVKNLFGNYEELDVGKSDVRLEINKIVHADDKVPQDILQKVYAEPEKKYYSISEVSQLFEVNSSLLRYWEKNFSQIKPSRNANGVRRYTKKDIEAINTIFYYLKIRKWTIHGVQEHLNKENSETKSILISHLERIKRQLVDLSKQLEKTKI